MEVLPFTNPMSFKIKPLYGASICYKFIRPQAARHPSITKFSATLADFTNPLKSGHMATRQVNLQNLIFLPMIGNRAHIRSSRTGINQSGFFGATKIQGISLFC
jgi:hypothetical protein